MQQQVINAIDNWCKSTAIDMGNKKIPQKRICFWGIFYLKKGNSILFISQ
jgi:hypothetical protein